MTRQEALEGKKNDFGVSKALLELTDSVTNEALWILKECTEFGICQEVLDQLYLDYDCKKPNEENMDKFQDVIFDALQACFTPETLRILVKSEVDSRNYHLMYKKLNKYFTSKVESQGRAKSPFANIDDDATYEVLFGEMAGMTPEPYDPHYRPFVEECDIRPKIDYDKIQDLFCD